VTALAKPGSWAAEFAWLRRQQQLARFRQALDRKQGRGRRTTMIPAGRIENMHLMTPEQRSAAIRGSADAAKPFLEAAVQTFKNRECEAGRWRVSPGRPRPRGRRERRTANATRGSPSGDDGPCTEGGDEPPGEALLLTRLLERERVIAPLFPSLEGWRR
jgi:hypothetical protein